MEDARRPGRMAARNKQPLNLRLDAGLILRMKRHALDMGLTVSDMVAGWASGIIPDADRSVPDRPTDRPTGSA